MQNDKERTLKVCVFQIGTSVLHENYLPRIQEV